MDDLLDRIPAGFVSFGDDGIISLANLPLGAILRRSHADLHGQHFESLLTIPSRIFYQTHVFPLLKMQGHVEEVYLSLLPATGEEVPIMINANRLESLGLPARNDCILLPMPRRNDYEDQILEARRTAEAANEAKDRMNEILIQQQLDLSERNRELELLRSSLEIQVDLRTSELNKMVEDLQGFNYSIAHDLRSPLRAILATSAILGSEGSGNLTVEQRKLLTRQTFNAKKLTNLVEDLLSFSKLGLAQIQKQTLDMTALAQAASAAAFKLHNRSDFQVEVQPELTAEGDQSMIQIVLENLFENAVKYSPGGGWLRFGSITHQGRTAYFLQDEGIGLSMEYAQKIFRPFERLHREEYPGTGIGLANVQRIIQRHGGKVWVHSSPDIGSTFYFTL